MRLAGVSTRRGVLGTLLTRGLQSGHRSADLRGVSAVDRGLQSLRGLHHRLIVRAHGGRRFRRRGRARHRLVGKGLVDGLAESVPQLLFLTAVQRHAVRLFLPTLLQGLDGIDAQARLGRERVGFVDEGLAPRQRGFLRRLQRFVGRMNDRLPLLLQFGKQLLAQMPAFAPALRKLVQLARCAFPVGALAHADGPGLDLLDQGQALRLGRAGLCAHFLEPGIDHGVCAVAGGVKALPQRGVGRGLAIHLFPGLAQLAQAVLQLAPGDDGLPAHSGLALGGIGSRCGGLSRIRGGFSVGRFSNGGGFGRHGGGIVDGHRWTLGRTDRHRLEPSLGALAQLGALGVDQGLVGAGLDGARGVDACRRCRRGGRGLRGRRMTRAGLANLLGPSGHGGQRRLGVGRGGLCGAQGGIKGFPHRLQLLFAGVQRGAEFGVHAGPLGIGHQGLHLGLPAAQVGLHRLALGLGLEPRFGGQNLDALRQQHGGFALDLGLVLQVLDRLDALGQGLLETSQWLARQRRARLGGIALPSERIAQHQTGGVAQGSALVGPGLYQGVLLFQPAQLIQALAHHLGGAAVAHRHLVPHGLQRGGVGLGVQPFAQTRGTLARGGCREGTPGQGIQG